MDEVTHKDIFDRLVKVEQKVDEIDANTIKIRDAFDSVEGAFTVLGWIAAVAKPVLWLVAGCTALYAFIEHVVKK